MAIFGKKKICPVCGQEVKGILNYKIKDNQTLCKDCSHKIHMDFSMLPYQSVEDIQKHLKYRDENKKKLEAFITTRAASSMRIDDNQQLWYIEKQNEDNPAIYRFDEIIDYELQEDGNTITKGGVGSALVGGALFGPAGALIGGVTGKKKSKTVVKSMVIHISLNNNYYYHEKIYLLSGLDEYKVGGFMYNQAKAAANNVISALDSMCKIATEAIANQEKINNENNYSVTDELKKFKELYDLGILTEEEFAAKKKKLLDI